MRPRRSPPDPPRSRRHRVRTARRRAPRRESRLPRSRRSSAPSAHRMPHQRGDIGARIAALTVLLHEHAERVAPAQRRLALPQLIGRQLEPAHAILPPQPPGELLRLEVGAAREHEQHPLPRDQLADAGLVRERGDAAPARRAAAAAAPARSPPHAPRSRPRAGTASSHGSSRGR